MTQHLSNKDFRSLWLAQVISQFGDRINQMALIGLIAGRAPGSAWELAKLLSFTIIPVFLIGPVAGVYVDRWDRRTTLFVCDLLRGILVLSIPFVFMPGDSMIPIYIVVFLVFCLSRFYLPAKMSLIPDLVSDQDLLAANSLFSTTGMIAFVLGFALGGFLVETIGSRGGFIFDAMTFFISAALVSGIKPAIHLRFPRVRLVAAGREVIDTFKKSLLQEIKDGVRYFKDHAEIRFILNIFFILFAAAGAIYVVMIVFIQQSFRSTTSDLGVLAIFLGVGLFFGALGYGRWGAKASHFKIMFLCLAWGGILLILFSWVVRQTQNLMVAGGLSFMMGLMAGPIFIGANTVIHRASPSEMRGKVFSGLEVVIHFAFLLTMLLSSFLAEHLERFWVLVGIGVIFSGVGLVGLRRIER